MRDQELLVLDRASAIGLCRRSCPVLGTGGGAFGNVSTGINGSFQSSTKAGWTAGAGIEAAFGENLTARVEYLYMRLQNSSCTNPSNCGLDLLGGTANDTVKFSTSMIRLGIDYKFR
jgi:outer membrane immunogenic protein